VTTFLGLAQEERNIPTRMAMYMAMYMAMTAPMEAGFSIR
jgi:hypothetical protein